jgi:hypothetical protein
MKIYIIKAIELAMSLICAVQFIAIPDPGNSTIAAKRSRRSTSAAFSQKNHFFVVGKND